MRLFLIRLAEFLANSLIFFIKIYRYLISPLLGSSCIYYPSCSEYAIQALRQYGPFTGLKLAVFRILRCHPFEKGGLDPVPPKNQK